MMTVRNKLVILEHNSGRSVFRSCAKDLSTRELHRSAEERLESWELDLILITLVGNLFGDDWDVFRCNSCEDWVLVRPGQAPQFSLCDICNDWRMEENGYYA